MEGGMEGGREEGGLCSTPTFIYNMAATLSVLATPPSAARLSPLAGAVRASFMPIFAN